MTEYIFSPLLPLVLFAVRECETVIAPFHATSMTLLAHSSFSFHMTIWLKAKLASLHTDFIHGRCDEKGSIDPEEKESLQFCGFLSSVYCILLTYGLHRKNKLATTKWRR